MVICFNEQDSALENISWMLDKRVRECDNLQFLLTTHRFCSFKNFYLVSFPFWKNYITFIIHCEVKINLFHTRDKLVNIFKMSQFESNVSFDFVHS